MAWRARAYLRCRSSHRKVGAQLRRFLSAHSTTPCISSMSLPCSRYCFPRSKARDKNNRSGTFAKLNGSKRKSNKFKMDSKAHLVERLHRTSHCRSRSTSTLGCAPHFDGIFPYPSHNDSMDAADLRPYSYRPRHHHGTIGRPVRSAAVLQLGISSLRDRFGALWDCPIAGAADFFQSRAGCWRIDDFGQRQGHRLHVCSS